MIEGSKKRIGNFILTKKKQGKETFIIVSTLSGEWKMLFRADNKMFSMLDDVDNDAEKSLHTWITTLYASSHIVDAEFTNNLIHSIDSYFDGLKKAPSSDEEDLKILEDEKRAHEMMDKMDKLDDDER